MREQRWIINPAATDWVVTKFCSGISIVKTDGSLRAQSILYIFWNSGHRKKVIEVSKLYSSQPNDHPNHAPRSISPLPRILNPVLTLCTGD